MTALCSRAGQGDGREAPNRKAFLIRATENINGEVPFFTREWKYDVVDVQCFDNVMMLDIFPYTPTGPTKVGRPTDVRLVDHISPSHNVERSVGLPTPRNP